MKKNVIFLVLFLCAVVAAQSNCFAQSTVGAIYHNTCARYNGYYNANNKMKQGNKSSAKSLQDDYTKLLPVDKNDLNTSGSVPDIDSIILRLTLVNKLHPKSKWVDDCNLLIGRAYYMKKNYESAAQMFQYVVASKKHSKKDKKEYGEDKPEYDGVKVPWPKPKKSFNLDFLKHKSAHDEALLWLITTYEKLNKKDEVETILNLVEKNNDAIDFKYRGRLEAHKAQFMIDQKRYKDAIKPMIYAVALTTDDKVLRTRYVYILAQLYQLIDNSDKSIKAFKDVLTLQPDYKMEFYANINLANSYSSAGKSSGAEIITMLEKLADEKQYEEFRDQVYYSIAEINLKQNNKAKAIENLNRSIRASVNNSNQKGLSFLKLAEINFDDQKYPPSKKYYDSTLGFINKDYKDIVAVKERASVLSALIQQMNVIQLQDSLLKLAGMSEKDRNKVIEDALVRIEKEKEEALAKQKSMAAAAFNAKNTDASGGWYFYNATVKANGYNDFAKKWGTRKLEDNWRRADKRSDALTDNGSGDTEDANSTTKKEGAITKESLLANVPLTEEKKKEANKKIAEAYYKMGAIYKDELQNMPKAIDALETLETKYPGSDYEALTYYQLYVLYTRTNDLAKAEEYKQKVLKNYPNSTVAAYIKNPESVSQSKKGNDPIENYYIRVYNLYEQKKFGEALHAIDSSRILYPASSFAPKFDLVRAFIIAQTQSKDSFKTALTAITKKYTTGEEQQKAKDMLAFLAKNAANDFGHKKVDDSFGKTDFIFSPNNQHSVVILFDEIKPTAKAVTDSLVKYNNKYHGSESLKINTLLLDTKRQIIQIKQFKNSAQAMNYYKEIVASDKLLTISESTYHVFVIDDKNFSIFFKSGNIEQYMGFFDKNYH